jgi:anthranilate synthase/aminodeoxychorismate synthase-like glutamine amidotransferase
MTTSILFIDNFDSFSFNLVDEFRRRGCNIDIRRNDITAARALELIMAMPGPRMIVISPGPSTPAAAGCCIELIRLAAGKIPVFGVCLGHQAIVEAFGGVVGRAGELVHGASSPVEHDQRGIFAGIPCPMTAARYHSLATSSLPPQLRVSARYHDLVMAVEHTSVPIVGVQFHPESILTPGGARLIDNVIAWAGGTNA